MPSYNIWPFDRDGVLPVWSGDKTIDGAIEVLQLLRHHKKPVLFVTNNATKSRVNYKKFESLGVEAHHVDEIYGSAYASAVYISSVRKLPKDKKVYVIDMGGLEEELCEEATSFIGGTDPTDNTLGSFSLANWTPDPTLSKAFGYILRNEGCTFLVKNEDSTYPASDGLLPGVGSISVPLRYALGRDPIAIGKLQWTTLDCIRAKHDFDPKWTIMVGDKLNTDNEFSKAGGLATFLVLTGITKESEFKLLGPYA